jgi:hypothetical protein
MLLPVDCGVRFNPVVGVHHVQLLLLHDATSSENVA